MKLKPFQTIILQPSTPDKTCPDCKGKGFTETKSGLKLKCACAWQGKPVVINHSN